MEAENQQLKLDRNRSPKDEATDFENPDERLQAQNNVHQIALMDYKRGVIGRLTGSTNEAMNTGLVILFAILMMLLFSMIGMFFKQEQFGSATDNLFKIVLAVDGYICGTHQSSKQ